VGGATGAPGKVGFGDALQSALAQVNEMQSQSSAISAAYEKGETTDIAAVMLSRQQASVGFEATLQVRNRLLSAYKDIMNMPV
jgi:flagellar hook-basal body complex protein FliE